MKKLNEMERRCNAATPGPWSRSREDMDSYTNNPESEFEGVEHVAYLYRDPEQRAAFFGEKNRADLEFISEARADLPWCIGWMRRAAEAIGELRLGNYLEPAMKLEALLKELEGE